MNKNETKTETKTPDTVKGELSDNELQNASGGVIDFAIKIIGKHIKKWIKKSEED